MKSFLLLCFVSALLTISSLKAQEADSVSKWNNQWIIGLNGSQATYSNWSQGGVNSISGSASSVYKAEYKNQAFSYRFENNLKYGQIKNDGQSVRKTDDQILLRNMFEYELSPISSIVGNVNFQTQFAPGFEFTATDRTKISDFFAPAYFNQNIGYALTPGKDISFQAGAGFKQTIVTIDELATSYGVDEGKNFRMEYGLNLGVNYSAEILENVRLISSFESFSNLAVSLSSTDFIFRNELIGNINKYLNTNVQFTLMYDDDFSREIQLKQVLAVGLTFNLL